MANPADVLAAFIRFEEREHLFDRELFGVMYWPLVRHDVFRETLEALALSAPAHQRLEELPLSHWLGPQLKRLPSTLGRSVFRNLPKADLLVATHPRYLRYRDQYVCPYSQPLLWGTPRSRVLLTGQYQGRYFSPDAGEITRYVDLGLVLAHATFRARELAGMGMPAIALRELAALRGRLAHELGAALPATSLIRRVRTAVLSSLGMTPWFEQLLARVQPRLITTVVGYRLVHQLLTQCARAHGIPVAELQHGTIGASHAGYNFAPGRRPATFPDHLLAFGDIWRDLTPGLPLPAAQVHAIGYGWLELQRECYARKTEGSVRHILFLSQRDIGRELSALAVEVQHALPAGAFKITYRLHPSEANGWRERYPALAASAIHVETAQTRELYAAQAQADVQVGVYSTSLIEGIAFGLTTWLVTLPGHEQLAFLCERGLAQRVHNAAELTLALNEPLKPAAAGGEALWAPNPRQRFSTFVEQVLQGSPTLTGPSAATTGSARPGPNPLSSGG